MLKPFFGRKTNKSVLKKEMNDWLHNFKIRKQIRLCKDSFVFNNKYDYQAFRTKTWTKRNNKKIQ